VLLKKALASFHVTKPRVITVDGNKAYPVAIRELKMKKAYHMVCHFGLKKYLNNMIEQDHRFIKNEF
jgi:IS6 family transposase